MNPSASPYKLALLISISLSFLDPTAARVGTLTKMAPDQGNRHLGDDRYEENCAHAFAEPEESASRKWDIAMDGLDSHLSAPSDAVVLYDQDTCDNGGSCNWRIVDSDTDGKVKIYNVSSRKYCMWDERENTIHTKYDDFDRGDDFEIRGRDTECSQVRIRLVSDDKWLRVVNGSLLLRRTAGTDFVVTESS